MKKFVLRHIARQRIKTLLTAAIALLFVLALGYLQTAIINTESVVDHLYNTTIVTGEIKRSDQVASAPGRFHDNVIRKHTIENVSAFVKNALIEACHEFAVLTAANEDGSLPENWDMIAGININANLTDNLNAFDTLVGIIDIERYAAENSHVTGDDFSFFSWDLSEDVSWVTNWSDYTDDDFMLMQINFIQGFYPEDFILNEGSPIPVLLNSRFMGMHGYELGETVYISTSTMLRSWEWTHTPVLIAGVYNLNRLPHNIHRGVIMPVTALEHIIGNDLRYMSMQFEIDPVYNREIEMIEEEIRGIVEHISAGEIPLRLHLDDEELRLVVIPMEQNLSLLRLLYPVAIALSAIIGLGLSLLLMMQNAKAASIMRVLGTTITRSRTILCTEQMIVCIAGLMIGLAVLAILGWGFGFASSLGLAGVYSAGASVGTIVGAVVVTNRPPLELLQVKE